ncbi:MAG: Ion-translocating oxidoreductase complex subunit D [Chroococcopsis gigantea SAG 12.99]|jgi:Na+-transporting NADH:ubiquinone oxidoreductase subunit NqrB|nr:Ion-translocating oxidoreductase complex subunit D [Chroococcopsis gigantea SAG 12.99]
MVFQDSRDFQISFLSLFLFLGVTARDWTLRFPLLLAIFLSCLGFQLLFLVLSRVLIPKIAKIMLFYGSIVKFNTTSGKLSISSLKSSLITVLGLCLILRANNYETMILAGGLAIASKFIFSYQKKHFFNPANFGIISALVLTEDAWVSPGQWGADSTYVLLFMALAGIILGRVGRWETGAVFLGVYGGLWAVRDYWLGWTPDILTHQLSSGSLLLFSFFMITDPRSTPDAFSGRVVWSIALAGLTFILQQTLYISTAPFWALFILSPFTVIIDRFWQGQRFQWQTNISNPVGT